MKQNLECHGVRDSGGPSIVPTLRYHLFPSSVRLVKKLIELVYIRDSNLNLMRKKEFNILPNKFWWWLLVLVLWIWNYLCCFEYFWRLTWIKDQKKSLSMTVQENVYVESVFSENLSASYRFLCVPFENTVKFAKNAVMLNCFWGCVEGKLSCYSWLRNWVIVLVSTQVMPKQSGFEKRRDLYTLYHYLNHYNLFGYGYRSSAMSIIDDYLRMLKA